MFCPNCGNQMSDGAKFCANCGWSEKVKKCKKRSISILIIPITALVILVACIVLFKCLFNAWKNDLTRQIRNVKTVTEYGTETSNDIMDTVKFGSYPSLDEKNKEPIEWLVLEKQDNKALLLSKYILDKQEYNNNQGNITWETSSLRSWLNNDFINVAFSSGEQNKIQTIKNITYTNIDYGTGGGNETKDKIFCLSIDEIRQYFGEGIKASVGYQLGRNVETSETTYALFRGMINYHGDNLWWLRSAGVEQDCASIIYSGRDGNYLSTLGEKVNNLYLGVRPALWVSY